MEQLIEEARAQVAIARQYRRWGATTGNSAHRGETARHLAYAGELRRSAYYCYSI